MSVNNSDGRTHRLGGLRRFAIAITVLNVLGHTFFGFEQSWAQPLVALATTYSLELLLELIDAKACRRPLRFAGGARRCVDFLLPAHISGLDVAEAVFLRLTEGETIVAEEAFVRPPAGAAQ